MTQKKPADIISWLFLFYYSHSIVLGGLEVIS